MWASTTPIPQDLSDFWNIIWDYRESSEIEFSIPYVHPTFATRTGISQGILVMKQIVPLQAPDNVAQNPVIVLEHWAGDDFRVLAPQPVQDMNSHLLNLHLGGLLRDPLFQISQFPLQIIMLMKAIVLSQNL
jgi:hypothetical protein